MLIFFLFLHENIYCGYSLERPWWGASDEYPQYMFSWRNKKNIMWLPPLICSYEKLFLVQITSVRIQLMTIHWCVQLILAYSWARPAVFVAGKGRGGVFLFLQFLHFHSCSSFIPVPLFSGRQHIMTTRVDVSLNPIVSVWLNNVERDVKDQIIITFSIVCLQTLSFLSFSLFFSKVYNLVQLIMIW